MSTLKYYYFIKYILHDDNIKAYITWRFPNWSYHTTTDEIGRYVTYLSTTENAKVIKYV